MIVRGLDLTTDLEGLVQAMRDCAPRTTRQDLLPENEDDLLRAFGRVLDFPGMEVLVAEKDGRLVSILGMLFGPHIWNPTRTNAEHVFWWAALDAPYGAAHAVFEQMLLLCQERNAIPTFKAPIGATPGLGRLFKRHGLRPTEIAYIGG